VTARPGLLEAALRRERLVIGAGLLLLAALAWVYVVRLAEGMPAHGGMAMAMPQPAPWSLARLGWLALMWTIMMVAMMVPSAAPVILLFASVARRRRAQGIPAVPAAVFTLGYLLVWTGFGITAAVLQSALHAAALLSPSGASATPWLGGGLLVAAGVYQWLPLKGACLTHCRSPLGFFAAEWREGTGGALRMGMRHGLYCLGCCWLLMALLFVAGVMNLVWVALLAGVVLVEKLLPGGRTLGRAVGLFLVVWGAALLTGALRLPG
jgi:predicted metal-binding membrane protein